MNLFNSSISFSCCHGLVALDYVSAQSCSVMDNFNADEDIKHLWVTDDRIIGQYLSDELMSDRKDPVSWTPQLRRFFHHNKEIRCLEVLGGGEDVVVLLAKIEGITTP